MDTGSGERAVLSAGAMSAAEMFRRGETVEAVAAALGRARGTVEGYLSEFVASERPESIRAWVDDPTERRVVEAAREAGEGGRLRPIYEKLGGNVPYVQIRVVLAHRWGGGGEGGG